MNYIYYKINAKNGAKNKAKTNLESSLLVKYRKCYSRQAHNVNQCIKFFTKSFHEKMKNSKFNPIRFEITGKWIKRFHPS